MNIKNSLNKLLKSVRTSNMLFQNPSNELEKFNCFIKGTRIYPSFVDIKGLKRYQRKWFRSCFKSPITLIATFRRSGKTFFTINLANFLGLSCNKKVGVIVSNYSRLNDIKPFIKSKNVNVFNCSSINSCRGNRFDVVIIDEDDTITQELLETILPTTEYLVIIGTRKGGYFSQMISRYRQSWLKKIINKIKRTTSRVNVVITPFVNY